MISLEKPYTAIQSLELSNRGIKVARSALPDWVFKPKDLVPTAFYSNGIANVVFERVVDGLVYASYQVEYRGGEWRFLDMVVDKDLSAIRERMKTHPAWEQVQTDAPENVAELVEA